MKILFENDPDNPGYGRICFSDVPSLDGEGWKCSIQETGNDTYLGRSGWEGQSECFIEPLSWTVEAQTLVLRIGPNVVSYFDAYTSYIVSLCGENQARYRGGLNLDWVPAVPHPAISELVAAGSSPRTESEVKAPPEQKKEILPDPEPAPAPAPAPDTEATLEQAPVETHDTPPPLEHPSSGSNAAKKRWFPVLATVVFLLLVCGTGWWWYTHKTGTSLVPTDSKGNIVDNAPIVSPGELVKRFFANNPTPQGAMDLSGKLPKEVKESAAGQELHYRLWLFAAERGELPAASFELARSVDPGLPAWGSIKKNGSEAWGLYSKASASVPQAMQARQQLEEWLKHEANRGNKDATEWLRIISERQTKK